MATFQPGSQQALQYLSQLLAARRVDPRAARAVFSVEGASGGIGDGGHAFGPGQFNNAGGVWTGKYAGLSPQQLNQKAWSPQGLTELADRVSHVAAGQKGAQAIQSIVTRFERPADPRGEIQKSLARFGMPGAAWGGGEGDKGQPLPPGSPAPTGLSGFSTRDALMQSLIGQQNAYLTGQPVQPLTIPQLMGQFNTQQQAGGGKQFFAGATPKATPYTGKVKFLGNTAGENGAFLNALSQAVAARGGTQVKLTSGYRDPQHNAAVGGVQGSLHTRGDAMDGYAMIGGKWVPLGTALLPVAKKYGLRSGDVAGFFNGGKDPVHVDYGLSL